MRRATWASSAAYWICCSDRRGSAQLVVVMRFDFAGAGRRSAPPRSSRPAYCARPGAGRWTRSITLRVSMPSLARRRRRSSPRPKPTFRMVGRFQHRAQHVDSAPAEAARRPGTGRRAVGGQLHQVRPVETSPFWRRSASIRYRSRSRPRRAGRPGPAPHPGSDCAPGARRPARCPRRAAEFFVLRFRSLIRYFCSFGRLFARELGSELLQLFLALALGFLLRLRRRVRPSCARLPS
jgi:hypothetical protein